MRKAQLQQQALSENCWRSATSNRVMIYPQIRRRRSPEYSTIPSQEKLATCLKNCTFKPSISRWRGHGFHQTSRSLRVGRREMLRRSVMGSAIQTAGGNPKVSVPKV
jgi:hypothetical protein